MFGFSACRAGPVLRLTRQRLSGFDHLHHLLLRRRRLLGALGRAIRGLPLDLPQTHHLHEGHAAAGGVALALRAVGLAVGEGLLPRAQTVAVFPSEPGESRRERRSVFGGVSARCGDGLSFSLVTVEMISRFIRDL